VTFESLTDDELTDLTEAVGRKFYDLVGEKERRGLVAQQPSTVVAFEIRKLRAKVVAHHELSTLSAAAIAESAGGPVCHICERAVESLGTHPAPDAGLLPALLRDRLSDGEMDSAL